MAITFAAMDIKRGATQRLVSSCDDDGSIFSMSSPRGVVSRTLIYVLRWWRLAREVIPAQKP
jgi:hypothetical protein